MPTPLASSDCLRSPSTPTATSSSLGRATVSRTSTRTAPPAASSPGASALPALTPGHRVPGQHLHHEQPVRSVGRPRRRRRLRRHLAQQRPGRQRLRRHLRAGASTPPGVAGGRRVPGQQPTPLAPSRLPVGGPRRRRRLRRRLGELRPGWHRTTAIFARRFTLAGVRSGRRVPGQHLHHRLASSSRRWRLDADGDFVVAWHERTARTATALNRRLRPALQTPPASPLAAEFQVNIYTIEHPERSLRSPSTPTATSSSPGMSYSAGRPRMTAVFARRFDAARRSPVRRVPGEHLHRADDQFYPSRGPRRRRRLRHRLG